VPNKPPHVRYQLGQGHVDFSALGLYLLLSPGPHVLYSHGPVLNSLGSKGCTNVAYFKAADLGFDLGNSKFSICVRGGGIIASEASYVAFKGRSLHESTVIAIGDEAKSMHGKTHPGLQVLTPMQTGVIVDCRVASILLKAMLKKVGLRWYMAKPRILVGTLFGASSIERKAFIDVAASVGPSKVLPVYEPLAAANGINIDIASAYANVVVDIGEGATEAMVVASGEKVLAGSIRVGGYNLDLAIVDLLRRRHGLVITTNQARQIKEELTTESESSWISVRGFKLLTSCPDSKLIDKKELSAALVPIYSQIKSFILATLEKLPPEVAVDLIDNGIHLCGGGAQSELLVEMIEEATKLKVHVAARPSEAVIRGCINMLNFIHFAS